MKEFVIRHTETLSKDFYIEAETPELAMAKYQRMLNNGELDFSDEDMEDSSDEIVTEITCASFELVNN